MNILVMVTAVTLTGVPLPFEEKESASPPALLFGLVDLLRLVSRNGFLELEVDGVYGPCCLSLVLPCLFQHLKIVNLRVKAIVAEVLWLWNGKNRRPVGHSRSQWISFVSESKVLPHRGKREQESVW